MTEDHGDLERVLYPAISQVVRNWRQLRPKQLREALPGKLSSTWLRLIRANACRETARDTGKSINCAKWMSSPSTPAAAGVQFTSKTAIDEISMRTGAYLCDQCKHPIVTNSVLVERLGLTRDNEDFSERTWRRYINDCKPMPIPHLRLVIANAFGKGWLGLWQFMAIGQQINDLQAVQSGLRVLAERVSQRKAFRLGKFPASKQEMFEEFDKQFRLLHNATTVAIDTRLQRTDLSTDQRAFLNEVRYEILAARAIKD